MNRVKVIFRSELFLSILLLLLVSGLAYLPFVGHLGYFNDDWYEMFSVGARGPQVYHDLFSIDRPGRAYLMIPLYLLFGPNPLPYNLSAYLFRLLGGLSVLWIFRMLWPQAKRKGLLASLFFLVFPGFLSQPNAIDFQSHIAALFFATFSIALTLQALLSSKLPWRIALTLLSVFFGLAYLSQMEYYIGFEIIRFIFIYLLAGRRPVAWPSRLWLAVKWWLPFCSIPVLFLGWRLFFFASARKATDINVQLGTLTGTPLHTLLAWGVSLLQDVLDVIFLGWGIPLYQLWFGLTARQMLYGLGMAAIGIALTLWVFSRFPKDAELEAPPWIREVGWAALLVVIGGMLPITLSNRAVTFPDYSRYTLISLIGAVLILAALLDLWKNHPVQNLMISLMVGLALLTHFSNGLNSARQEDATRTFWWQVSWRIPQMAAGTTLLAELPAGGVGEDYVIWGPANLIYYPESRNAQYVQPSIYASLLDQAAAVKVLSHQRQEYDNRRTIRTYANYRNVLILAQPSLASCVQVMDGSQPEFSSSESPIVMLLASYSKAGDILGMEKSHTPPQPGFGSEPAHDWCYYYEKASLARQQGDWQTVAGLADQASGQRLVPQDPIEWMPFLQAYAHFGNQARLKELAPDITADPFVAQQACRILTGMQLDASTLALINGQYCPQN